MPRMSKDEALVAVRKLLDEASETPLTILKKEISWLSVTALLQLHDFLNKEVIGITETE